MTPLPPNSSETPAVSVVIPSYNRKECLLTLLADLHKQKGVTFEVIVVDDASPDGSADAIAAAFPNIILLRSDTNGGPCVARNRGIRAARSEIIVGLDSDVSVPDNTLLAQVVKTFTNSLDSVALLALRLLKPDGISEDTPRWWHPVSIETHADHTFETSYFSGTGYAIRRAAALDAGLFPEIFYMHYEEVELAWRLIDKGKTLIYVPNLRILHHARPTPKRSEVRNFFKPRNQIILTLRCYPVLQGFAYAIPRFTYFVIQSLLSGKPTQIARVVASTIKLLPVSLAERSPLKTDTWKRLKTLTTQAKQPRHHLNHKQSRKFTSLNNMLC